MRFLQRAALIAAFFCGLGQPAQATLYPQIPLPLQPSQGGLGPAAFPGIQSGDFVVGFGDSLIANTAGSSTCATGTSFHTGTGTCMLDKIGEDTGAQVSNLGLGGTCLQLTATLGGQCNSANSGYARYTNAYNAGSPGFAGLFTHDPINEWVILDYGTNDWVHADAGATAGAYYTQLTAIVQYLVNTQHLIPSHIRIVGLGPADIYGGSTATQPQQADIATQAAVVAAQNYTTYADTLGLLTKCWTNNTYTTDTQCTDDGLHPNAVGSALIATAVENANYQAAVGAIGAYASLAVMMHQPLLLSPHIIGTPNFATPLSIGNGGTGSASQNFVDLSTVQTVGGNKTFDGTLAVPYGTTPYIDLFLGPNAGAANGSGTAAYGQVNMSGLTHTAYWTGSGGTIAGVAGNCTGFGEYGGGGILALNCNGNIGVQGTVHMGTPLSVADGGTGSATQNFVDLSSTQSSIAGNKTFTNNVKAGTLLVGTAGTSTSTGFQFGNTSTNGGAAQSTRIAGIDGCNAGHLAVSHALVSIDDMSAGYKFCQSINGDMDVAGNVYGAGLVLPLAATIGNNSASNNTLQLGTANQIMTLQWNRPDGGWSQFSTNQSVTINGVTSTAFALGDAGVANLLAFDKSGNVGTSGAMHASSFYGSGANITSGTIPNSALATAPLTQTCTTWVPTDMSGAFPVLPIFVTAANYCQTGKEVVMSMDISFPVTADGSVAVISVPVTPAAYNQALVLGFNGVGASFRPTIAGASGSYMVMYSNVSSTGVPNSTFSGARIVVSGSYIAQ